MVSDGVKRSAEDGSGAGGGGKRPDSAGSNAYSNSEKGTGGCGDDGGDIVVVDEARCRSVAFLGRKCGGKNRAKHGMPR